MLMMLLLMMMMMKTMMTMTVTMTMINMDHIYIYISKVHRHGISKIRNPSTIPARSNVRIAADMFHHVSRWWSQIIREEHLKHDKDKGQKTHCVCKVSCNDPLLPRLWLPLRQQVQAQVVIDTIASFQFWQISGVAWCQGRTIILTQ